MNNPIFDLPKSLPRFIGKTIASFEMVNDVTMVIKFTDNTDISIMLLSDVHTPNRGLPVNFPKVFVTTWG